MKWFRNSPVRSKLMILSLGPSLVILFLCGATFLTVDWFLFREALKSDLEANAQFIARTTRAALAFHDTDTANRILDGLAVKENILQGVIYDNSGAVFAAFNPFGANVPNRRDDWEPDLKAEGKFLFFVQPIEMEGRRLGTLHLAATTQGAFDRLVLFGITALAAVLLFSLLAYAIAIRLQEIIAAPVLDLAETARNVSDRKDYSLRAQKRSDDEIGFLTDAFNRMLEEIQKTIGELEAFSYTVSHDLRAPLRAMQGYAQALMEDYGENLDDGARHHLQRISVAGKRLDSLIQDVLTYSRVIRAEILPATVNLDKLVDDILQQYPAFQSPDVDVSVSRPLHSVRGQETLLVQCIANLLDNAAKFVARGTKPVIKIRSEMTNGKVRLWVEDNGIGIGPKHQRQIFKMFERIHHVDEYEGTGIGLSIVCKAMERMGGAVGLESAAGDGSKFWLELPAAT